MKPYSGESSRTLMWLMSVVLLLIMFSDAKAQHFFYIDNYIGGNYTYCTDYKLSSKYMYLDKKNHFMKPFQEENRISGYGMSIGKEVNLVFGKRIDDPKLRYSGGGANDKKRQNNQYESAIAFSLGMHINAQGYNVKYEEAFSLYSVNSHYWLTSIGVPFKIKYGNFSRLSSTPFSYHYIYFGAKYNIPFMQSYLQVAQNFREDTYYDDHTFSKELPHYFSFLFGINFLIFDVSFQYSPKMIEFDFAKHKKGNLLSKDQVTISVLFNIPRKQ